MNILIKETMTGTTSILPFDITKISTHFYTSGIPGGMYPVLNLQHPRTEMIAKTGSDTANEVR